MVYRTWFAVLSIVIAGTTAQAADDGVPSVASASAPLVIAAIPPPTRGRLLPILYVSLGALQAYDGYTTVAAVKAGGVEMNPLMAGIANQPVLVWSVKAGITVATVSTAERLWREHRRTQAVALLIVSNSLMAVVAARNAAVMRSLK